MDTVTISAIVFLVVLTVVNSISVKTKNGLVLVVGLIAAVGNFFQFGYFSGIWPFTVMGWFYVVLFCLIGVAFAIKAYIDAKEAE